MTTDCWGMEYICQLSWIKLDFCGMDFTSRLASRRRTDRLKIGGVIDTKSYWLIGCGISRVLLVALPMELYGKREKISASYFYRMLKITL